MKKIHTKINEFNIYNQSLSEDEMLEMASLYGKNTGLDDVVIWVGSTLKSKHGKRIKVSNIKSKTGSSVDCFTITIPKFEIIGNMDTKHITTQKLNKIIDFIKLNMNIICDICDEKIDTVEFISKMKKI
jgi:hypothetical protein